MKKRILEEAARFAETAFGAVPYGVSQNRLGKMGYSGGYRNVYERNAERLRFSPKVMCQCEYRFFPYKINSNRR